MTIMLFGFGYCAANHAARRDGFDNAAATVTTRNKAISLARDGLEMFVFSPAERDPGIEQAIGQADAALVSIAPGADGDPTLLAYAKTIARAKNLSRVIYLSTIGVYGDHQGAWIDESADCRPTNLRSQWRLKAEEDWRTFEARTGKPTHILRLAGIYGPGQNALVNLRNGTAKRIIKPGQVFNRIHVDDIGAAIDACLAYEGPGRVWNIADDEPAPGEDVVTFAASLLGIAPPPAIPFESADLSAMARSFYGETKRVVNRAMKERLGAALKYPTYREGIAALFAAGNGQA